MANRIQYRRDTAVNWTAANPILALGEPGFETDTKRRKTGDGTTAWNSLAYAFDKGVADGVYTLDRISAARSPALLPWYASLANRHYARADIAVLGDSITEGQGATQIDRRWIARLRDQLRARHATTGLTGGGRGFIAAATTGETSYTHAATLAGSPVISGGYGPKRASALLDAAGKSVTFTVKGTSADMVYLRGASSGSVSITVDGGAPATVSLNGTQVDGQKYRFSLGASGTHTVVIAWASGTLNFVHGLIEYDGDESKGISVHDCGHYGWDTSAGGSGWLSSTSNWPVSVASLGASLVVIALGTNDPGVVTAAQHKTNLQQIISLVRAGYTTLGTPVAPIVLVPYGGKSTASATWADYVASQYAVVAEDPTVSICDLSLRVPNAASNPGAIYADVVGHPTDKGHALFGDAVADFLSTR